MIVALGEVLLVAQTDGIEGLPFQDIGFAGLLGIVVWWLVRRVDREDESTASEISRLREQVETERIAHHQQMEEMRQEHLATFSSEQAAWRSEFARMREWMNEQIAEEKALTQQKSDEKHRIVNRLAVAEGALDTIVAVAPGCSCHALDGVRPVLERWEHRQAEERARRNASTD